MGSNTQSQYTTGSFSPQAEPVDFSGLTRPLGIEYVSSLGSSSYSRESTPSNGSSVHFMDGYRDFNGKLNKHITGHFYDNIPLVIIYEIAVFKSMIL